MSKSLEDIKDMLNRRLNLTGNEKEITDFIKSTKSDVLDGVDEDGNIIIVGIQQNVGFKISTHQSNGWIRINSYELVTDEEGNPYIQESETYEK